ncbi:alpha/beta-hydrolase [Pleurotus eryngii]|uniref:Alpha/beta-hydrolase n=1 Tax=Pleurotus eryngii TaxID=5323 RepID=A0A9P6DDL8_PLEER|nr:alpha/beta-hydrolase [Pleurotus eryngii]
MTTPTKAPYGTWESPISADDIVQGSKPIAELLVDSITHTIYHVESRPAEDGRNVLVETETGRDLVGKEWNVRTGVHEYGGGAAIVYGNIAYFSHYVDGRVYSVDVKTDGATPEAVTPDSNNLHRFADFDVHPKISELVVAIMEDHTNDPTGEAPSQVVNTLCVIDTVVKSVSPLVSGADFYSNARFSPDGSRLVWLQWFHPDMPWEGSELRHADVAITEGKVSLTNTITIDGVPSKISVAFPSWVNNDTLLFTSDRSGYQNPHKYVGGQATPVFLEPIAQDFSQPAWTLGWSPHAPIDETGQNILCTAWKDGKTVIYLVDIQSRAPPQLVESSFVAIDIIRAVSTESHQAVFSSPKVDADNAIIRCTLPSSLDPKDAEFTVVAPAEGTPVEFPDGIISIPQPLDIGPQDALVHVVYYPPNNPAYSGSSIPDESPPCVVNVHGGPTALENQALNWKKQYFTSRGWAWLDVNYGGSSGYGREYIQRLAGNWGIVDTEDSIKAVDILSEAPYRNLLDAKRSAIRGGSAGGYTTLATLSISSNPAAFAAGTSSYGISDLAGLAESTHKFESQYMNKLVGASLEEDPQLYKDRSPLYHADKITSPLLILQGELDRVVPKEQAEQMRDTICANGGVVCYKLYEGEGHGWRLEETIKDALERELHFYEGQLLKLK